MQHAQTSRTIVSLSSGARGALVLAGLLIVGAAYLLWSPIQLYPASGFPVQCGSGADLPTDDLGRAACGDANVIRQWQAGALAVAAVLVALGGAYSFGVRRRVERVVTSHSDEA